MLSRVLRKRRRAQQLEMLADDPLTTRAPHADAAAEADEAEVEQVTGRIPRPRRSHDAAPGAAPDAEEGVASRAWRG